MISFREPNLLFFFPSFCGTPFSVLDFEVLPVETSSVSTKPGLALPLCAPKQFPQTNSFEAHEKKLIILLSSFYCWKTRKDSGEVFPEEVNHCGVLYVDRGCLRRQLTVASGS